MKQDILHLVELARDMMDEIGLAPNTKKQYESSVFGPIVCKYQELGAAEYDSSIMEDLLLEYQVQYEGGEISKAIYNWRKRGVLLLNDLYKEGAGASWKRYCYYDLPKVPTVYENLFRTFGDSLAELSDSSRKRIAGITKEFLIYISNHGIESTDEISADTIRLYLGDAYSLHPNSMDSVVYSLRRFFRFLEGRGMDIHRIWLFLAFPMTAKKVKPAFPQDDIAKVLESVDTSAAPGKRNLAILSLEATTGLRGVDIINLELPDIRWRDCEIRISQHKTGNPLTLPLRKPVMDILADYILNERPKSDSNKVFLTTRAPHRPIKSSASLACIIGKHMRAAGIDRSIHDGKTFHGMRRSLGTGIVQGGDSTTLVAQVLGHKGIAVTKQYIDIDIAGLSKCILPMDTLGGDAL